MISHAVRYSLTLLLTSQATAQTTLGGPSAAELPPEMRLRPILPGGEFPRGGDELIGKFESGKDGKVFTTTDNKSFKVEFPVDPAKIKSGFAGEVLVKVEPEGRVKLPQIISVGLDQALCDFQQVKPSDLRDELKVGIAKLQEALNAPVPPGQSAAVKIVRDYDQGATSILETFTQAAPNEQNDNVKSVSLLYYNMLKRRDRGSNKVNFGFADNYPPESYPRVHELCQAVGAVRHSQRVVGTAFHLGNDVILTAAHCLRSERGDGPPVPENQIDFVFSLRPSSGSLGRDIPFGKRIYVGKYADGEDFAIIQAGQGNRTPSKINVGSLTFTPIPVGQNASVIVLGYKEGGDMTVVDGAHVLFPHTYTALQYNDLKLRMEAEIQIETWQLSAAPIEPDSESAQRRQRELETLAQAHYELRIRFEESILPAGQDGEGQRTWILRSTFVKSPALPAFGMDSATFGGHSGGPVINRQSFDVVGIFCRGMPDDPAPMRAGLERHEEAIPIMHVLRTWKKAHPTADDPKAPENFGFYNITLN